MAFHRLAWDQQPPEALRNAVVCIGNFDGVHRGHVALLETTCQIARSLNTNAIAISFDPPPIHLLQPSMEKLPLMTLEQRAEALKQHSDEVIILRTSVELLALGPEAFFEEILQTSLKIRGIVEGFNFCFGRNREGRTTLLAELCQKAGVRFKEVSSYSWNKELVSSSRVRQFLLEGNVRKANDLLGYDYQVQGIVSHGMHRGRTIGFPTANLEKVPTVLPIEGVYVADAIVGGKKVRAAVNLGANPTFGEGERKFEVHLLDFEGDLYGQTLAVTFLERLRDVRPFASKDELLNQLKIDVEQARNWS
jgi:riboflavin kinase / FMN adenylyltransferase